MFSGTYRQCAKPKALLMLSPPCVYLIWLFPLPSTLLPSNILLLFMLISWRGSQTRTKHTPEILEDNVIWHLQQKCWQLEKGSLFLPLPLEPINVSRSWITLIRTKLVINIVSKPPIICVFNGQVLEQMWLTASSLLWKPKHPLHR